MFDIFGGFYLIIVMISYHTFFNFTKIFVNFYLYCILVNALKTVGM